MKPIRLTVRLTEAELENTDKKYHFGIQNLLLLKQVYQEISQEQEQSQEQRHEQGQELTCELYLKQLTQDSVVYREMQRRKQEAQTKADEGAVLAAREEQTAPVSMRFAQVVITLGARMDELLDSYLRNEELQKAYMLDCLSMELLSRAYEQLDMECMDKIGLHCGKLEFLGDRYPLEWIKLLLQDLEITQVSCNEEYQLTPTKSVILLAELTQQKRGACMHQCVTCRNNACPQNQANKLNYGYRRIFGDREIRMK